MHPDHELGRAVAREMLIESATETILELMEREGVSKSDLARRLGTTRAFVTQILDGKRNLTLRTIADVAHVLGHEVRFIIHDPKA